MRAFLQPISARIYFGKTASHRKRARFVQSRGASPQAYWMSVKAAQRWGCAKRAFYGVCFLMPGGLTAFFFMRLSKKPVIESQCSHWRGDPFLKRTNPALFAGFCLKRCGFPRRFAPRSKCPWGTPRNDRGGVYRHAEKKNALGVFLTGTQSDLTFCMGRQWRKPLPACSFFCLDFVCSVLTTPASARPSAVRPFPEKE